MSLSIDRVPRPETLSRKEHLYRGAILSSSEVRDIILPHLTIAYNNIIKPEDLDENGQFQESRLEPQQSMWFGLFPKGGPRVEPDVFARLILPIDSQGRNSLHTFFDTEGRAAQPGLGKFSSLQPHFEEITSQEGKEMLEGLDPREVAELGGFISPSRNTNPFLLMNIMRYYSNDNGIGYWICGFVPEEHAQFYRLLGPALTPLNNDPIHFGNFDVQCMPYLIEIEKGIRALQTSDDPVHRRVGESFNPPKDLAA